MSSSSIPLKSSNVSGGGAVGGGVAGAQPLRINLEPVAGASAGAQTVGLVPATIGGGGVAAMATPSTSYTSLYTGRHHSPGSLMTPKSEALAMVGAAQRDEATDAHRWRQRFEPRVVELIDVVIGAVTEHDLLSADPQSDGEEKGWHSEAIADHTKRQQRLILTRACFSSLLCSVEVDLHLHARLFVGLAGAIHACEPVAFHAHWRRARPSLPRVPSTAFFCPAPPARARASGLTLVRAPPSPQAWRRAPRVRGDLPRG
jgi:hypothetical protein